MQIMTSWKEEGILLGRSEGEAKIVLLLLGNIFGNQLESEIEGLSAEALEKLAGTLLGFRKFQDLVDWLDGNAQSTMS